MGGGECGVWSVECGVWSVECKGGVCGVWSVAWVLCALCVQPAQS